MSTIASLALAIRARTEQLKGDLKPGLDAIKDWGRTAEAAGGDAKEVAREMARMRQELLRGGDGAAAAAASTSNLTERLQRAKQGAAALSGAMSAMSSQVGGAVGHVTRLGTSLTSAFLAGGPIALGATALAAGISVIAGASAKAAEEAKKASEENKKWMEAAQVRTRTLNDSLLETLSHIRALRLGAPELAGSFIAAEKDAAALKAKLDEVHEQRLKTQALERALAASGAAEVDPKAGPRYWHTETEKANLASLKTETERLRVLEAEVQKMQEGTRAADERLALEQDLEGTTKRVAAYKDRIKAAVSGITPDMERGAKAAKEQADAAERIARAYGSELAKRMSDAYGVQAKMHGDTVRAAEAAEAKKKAALKVTSDEGFLALGKHLTQAQKRRAEQSALNESLRQELGHLQAGSAAARERLDIQERLAERIKQAKGDEEGIALAKKIAATESAQLAATEAEAAAKAAEETKKQTTELEKQNKLTAKRLDITKEFRGVGNSGFGFGAGTVGGLGFTGGGGTRSRSPRLQGVGPNQGQGGGDQAGTLPELAPHVKAMESEISKIPAWSQRLEQALVSASGTTKASILELGRSTERAVGALRRDQDETKAKVRSMAKAIERAGNGTGAGD